MVRLPQPDPCSLSQHTVKLSRSAHACLCVSSHDLTKGPARVTPMLECSPSAISVLLGAEASFCTLRLNNMPMLSPRLDYLLTACLRVWSHDLAKHSASVTPIYECPPSAINRISRLPGAEDSVCPRQCQVHSPNTLDVCLSLLPIACASRAMTQRRVQLV